MADGKIPQKSGNGSSNLNKSISSASSSISPRPPIVTHEQYSRYLLVEEALLQSFAADADPLKNRKPGHDAEEYTLRPGSITKGFPFQPKEAVQWSNKMPPRQNTRNPVLDLQPKPT
ncbi:hypothetical protein MMC31_001665, partial [Peltigera leucophlebia]|nr:hypothetical protein [Peltigera leucophlebia]